MEFRELLRRSQTRIDLLFTMSKIPQARRLGQRMRSDVFADDVLSAQLVEQPVFALSGYDAAAFAMKGLPSRSWRSQRRLVEPDGIEPTTSCLQSTRSPS